MNAALGFYARTWSASQKAALIVRYWFHHHRWASIATLFVLYQIYAVVVGNNVMAAAATGDSTFIPPGWDATDSHGIPVSHYVSVPIDRGGWTDTGKAILAFLTDTIWVFHLFAISWALWLFDFILTFAWVDVISGPFVVLGYTIQAFFNRFEWLPLALAAAGLIGGVMIVIGKLGKGIAEMSMAVVVAVLAVMVYVNPAVALTTAGGVLDKAQDVGRQLTSIVTYDDIDARGLDETDLSNAITAPVVDLLVRDPAQSLAFGRVLSGECAEVFDEAMFDKPPVADQNHVRDKVNDCSEEAKQFNENPNFGQIISAAVIASSSASIFSIPIVLSFLFFFTVFGLLVAAVKAPIQAHIAVLPFMRYGLWRTTMDLVTGVASIVLLCISLAISMKIILETTRGIDKMFEIVFGGAIQFNQFPVARGMFIDLLILVALVFLIRVKLKAKKAGRTFAEQISKTGAGRGKPAPSRAVQTLKAGMTTAVSSLAGGAASGLLKGGPAGAAAGAATSVAKVVAKKATSTSSEPPQSPEEGAGKNPPGGPSSPPGGKGKQAGPRTSPPDPETGNRYVLPDLPFVGTSSPDPETGNRYTLPDAPLGDTTSGEGPNTDRQSRTPKTNTTDRETKTNTTGRKRKRTEPVSGHPTPAAAATGQEPTSDYTVDDSEVIDVERPESPQRARDSHQEESSRGHTRSIRVNKNTRIKLPRPNGGGRSGTIAGRPKPRNTVRLDPTYTVTGAVPKVTSTGELRFEPTPRTVKMDGLANRRNPDRREVRARMTEFMRPLQK